MSDIDLDVNPNSDVEGDSPILPAFDAAGKEIEYLFYCSATKKGTTKSSGRTKIGLKLEVGGEGEFKGAVLWHDLTVIPKGMPGHGFFVASIKAFGLLRDGDVRLKADAEDFKDRWARATVKLDSWVDGLGRQQKRTKVNSWNTDHVGTSQLTRGPGKPSSENDIEEIPF